MEELIKEFTELKNQTTKLVSENELVQAYNRGATEMLDYVINRLKSES
jgi:hypothetical protein